MLDRSLPWYRERWPWLLMLGPAAVVVAGAITTWIAFATADGLVAEDYYKQGLAINKVLKREETARRLGISAEVFFQDKLLRVRLRGDNPPVVFAQLVHATRGGQDLRLRLVRAPNGVYETHLPPLAQGRWRVILEDPAAGWRLVREP
jgi:uncharacterized protein